MIEIVFVIHEQLCKTHDPKHIEKKKIAKATKGSQKRRSKSLGNDDIKILGLSRPGHSYQGFKKTAVRRYITSPRIYFETIKDLGTATNRVFGN